MTPGSHAGVTATVGSTATPSGTTTATVAGHPVYTFAKDHAPGDVNGEGLQEFGGTWYAVSASGAAVQPGRLGRARRRADSGLRAELGAGVRRRLLRFVAARPSMGDWAGHVRVSRSSCRW